MKKFLALTALASLALSACGPQVAERGDNGLLDAVLSGDGSVEQTVTVERAPQSNGPSEPPAEDVESDEVVDE